MIPQIGWLDLILSFLYLFFIYFFAILYRNKKIKKNPEYKYFLFGLTAKFIGGIGFALFSIYYYQGGDTFVFFNAAKGLNDYFLTDFGKAAEVFFTLAKNLELSLYDFAPNYHYILRAEDVLSVVKITTAVNFLSFNSYLVSSILFALFSFLGLWFGFSNFSKLYPRFAKYMFVPFLLIPTALLWSSGILKDTVTQGAIGWVLYAFSNIFIFKRKVLFSVVIVFFGAVILFLLKPYILYVLFPCLFIWVQSNFKNLIQNSFVRMLLKPFLFLVLVAVSYFVFQKISTNAGKYGLENLENTLIGFQSWHGYLAENENQSGYTLGEMEFTPAGILKKVPAALNVTFFRPYLWQVRNIPTLLGAIEGSITLVFFCYLLINLRLKFFKVLFSNKEVFFLMIFAVVFGIMVGVSSYNYGALSRYKIPAVMFFVLSLVIIQQLSKEKK